MRFHLVHFFLFSCEENNIIHCACGYVCVFFFNWLDFAELTEQRLKKLHAEITFPRGHTYEHQTFFIVTLKIDDGIYKVCVFLHRLLCCLSVYFVLCAHTLCIRCSDTCMMCSTHCLSVSLSVSLFCHRAAPSPSNSTFRSNTKHIRLKLCAARLYFTPISTARDTCV